MHEFPPSQVGCPEPGAAALARRRSLASDQVKHVAAGIADRYYPAQPAEDIAESFVQEGFTAVRISISNVIARSGLG